ncbi:GNAT family N-acetyltransferase [Bacillus sp. Bva_UNVM-123]|uniref:GNAT family N-acetyltransferase n=1 Tax=Bacillus sp. Bva_UNVM-123 TaxID=2829798 RepID=UPI00391F55BD
MKLHIKEINEKLAIDILTWKYEPPYDFYNNEVNAEAIKEMLDTPYHIVADQKGELVGFYCYGTSAQVPSGSQFGAYEEDFIDIGIGMNPHLTGKGNGSNFFSFILQHIQTSFPQKCIRLTVATFNKRAIHLYEKLGFEKQIEFNSGQVEFMTMVLE